MQTLEAIFAASVAVHGDRVAIDVPAGRHREADRVTYAQLDDRACRVAAAIDAAADSTRAEGGARQQVVIVVLPRDGVEVYAAQLGILRGGRAWRHV